jgi:uncharacterized protein (DUF1697 family)
MQRYIAFLRGINVGGHRVKMDALRALFASLGLKDVSTFIASGNVLFSSDSPDPDRLRDEIEEHLHAELGYEVATFLRTPDELSAIVAFDPGHAGAPIAEFESHYVILLDEPASNSLRSDIQQLESETDQFRFSEREVHWLIRGKISESPLFAGGLDRATKGTRTTSRNMNTLVRIMDKIGGAD